jgi:hypothetical protein
MSGPEKICFVYSKVMRATLWQIVSLLQIEGRRDRQEILRNLNILFIGIKRGSKINTGSVYAKFFKSFPQGCPADPEMLRGEGLVALILCED